MNLIVALIIFLIFAQTTWKSILKNGAYPQSVKWYLKWLHALILCWLMVFTLCALSDLFWLIHYRSEVIDSFISNSKTPLFDPVSNILRIVFTVSGLTLPFVCNQMTKCNVTVLKWYFLLWPISFLSSMYVVITSLSKLYPAGPMEFLTAVLCLMFLVSILFYSNDWVRGSLFVKGPTPQH